MFIFFFFFISIKVEEVSFSIRTRKQNVVFAELKWKATCFSILNEKAIFRIIFLWYH